MAQLAPQFDKDEIEATTAAFDRLKEAIAAVNAELEKLANKPHGGITINAVGKLVQCEVKPVQTTVQEHILNCERTAS